jgi:hypothetical protein
MKNSNKLIAEFMGYESYEYRGYTMFVFEENNHRTDVDLHYHTSWNWLMPVVEEIDHLQFEEVVEIETGLKMRSLSATYNAVVEFIKQQNNNN